MSQVLYGNLTIVDLKTYKLLGDKNKSWKWVAFEFEILSRKGQRVGDKSGSD